MPPWELHEKICRSLIGYYNKEIDKLIDAEESHDASRYNVETLAKQIQVIGDHYGEFGLKQLVLHHYLDRIQDLYVSYRVSGCYYTPEEFDIDPKNILNLLLYSYEYLDRVLYRKYSGKRNRSRRQKAKYILDKAYVDLRNHPEVRIITPIVEEIVSVLKNNLDYVLTEISRDESTQKRIENAVNIKENAMNFMKVYNSIIGESKPMSESRVKARNPLIERILRLDEKYMDAHDAKTRASILSQVIQLAQVVDPNVRDVLDEKIDEYTTLYERVTKIITTVLNNQYSSYDPYSWLDYTRAKILSKLAEDGYI